MCILNINEKNYICDGIVEYFSFYSFQGDLIFFRLVIGLKNFQFSFKIVCFNVDFNIVNLEFSSWSVSTEIVLISVCRSVLILNWFDGFFTGSFLFWVIFNEIFLLWFNYLLTDNILPCTNQVTI